MEHGRGNPDDEVYVVKVECGVEDCGALLEVNIRGSQQIAVPVVVRCGNCQRLLEVCLAEGALLDIAGSYRAPHASLQQVSDLLAQYGHGTGVHRAETAATLHGQSMSAERSLGRSLNPASPASALQGSIPRGLGMQSQQLPAVPSGSGGVSPRTGTSITTAMASQELGLHQSSAGFSDSPDVSTPWTSAAQPRVDRGQDEDTPPSTRRHEPPSSAEDSPLKRLKTALLSREHGREAPLWGAPRDAPTSREMAVATVVGSSPEGSVRSALFEGTSTPPPWADRPAAIVQMHTQQLQHTQQGIGAHQQVLQVAPHPPVSQEGNGPGSAGGQTGRQGLRGGSRKRDANSMMKSNTGTGQRP